jgi:hypothetical protein
MVGSTNKNWVKLSTNKENWVKMSDNGLACQSTSSVVAIAEEQPRGEILVICRPSLLRAQPPIHGVFAAQAHALHEMEQHPPPTCRLIPQLAEDSGVAYPTGWVLATRGDPAPASHSPSTRPRGTPTDASCT